MKESEIVLRVFSIKTRKWLFIVLYPANIRLGEDVFSVTFFSLLRRLQDIIARRLANTSWIRLGRYLEDVLKTFCRRLAKTLLQTRLEDVLEDEKLLHWRGLQDVLENKKCLLGTNHLHKMKTIFVMIYLL